MYEINRTQNSISKLPEKTFSELNFREREHLQEWIANNPASLGEELLIIQKEFSGFEDTRERLDLLALDKDGNLVIIENKLDDSGKDVTWQSIKYASYCSSLSKQDIIEIYQKYLVKTGSSENAEEKISVFFENAEFEELFLNQGQNSQRIILVAANFRKEVTSSVLWLMNFKIKIQCFKVTPYQLDGKLFLNIVQILPPKDTEDLAIKFASKAEEEIKVKERVKKSNSKKAAFWAQFLSASNKQNNIFSKTSPREDYWVSTGMGASGISLLLSINKKQVQCLVEILTKDKQKNEDAFDYLFTQKEKIEKSIGEKLIWDRMDDNKSCKIRLILQGVNYLDEKDHTKINDFFIDASTRFDKAFREPVEQLKKLLKG